MSDKKPSILIVDDMVENIDVLYNLLKDEYNIKVATGGEKALQVAKDTSPPDLILLDVMMPGMDGYQVAKQLKEDETTRIIPIIMVTTLSEVPDRVKALEAGADDFLTKPVEAIELTARVKSLLKVKAYNDHMLNYQSELEEKVKERTSKLDQALRSLEQSNFQTVELIFDLLNLTDEYLGSHCKRVAHYANNIAKEIKMNPKDRKDLVLAAMLHDIGLIGFPRVDLLKIFSDIKVPEETQKQYQQHMTTGSKLLSLIDRFKKISTIITAHHECVDGSGQPGRLEEEQIPLESRIIAVADRYDQLTHMRENMLNPKQALSILFTKEVAKYDSAILEAFTNVVSSNDPFNYPVRIDITNLKPGMILAKSITNRRGLKLLAANTELNAAHIEIINRYNLQKMIELPIYIFKI